MSLNFRRYALALIALVPFTVFAQDPAPAAAPAAPAPSADAANTGTVIFFREKKFAGSMIRFKVREAGKELGKLSSGTYFTVQLPAGKHEFEVHSEAKDLLTIEVEPGDTYYVVGTVTMGVMAGHPNLSPSDQAAYEKAKASLKDVTGQDIGDGKD